MAVERTHAAIEVQATRALRRRSFVALFLCERSDAAARGCGLGGWFPGIKPVPTRRLEFVDMRPLIDRLSRCGMLRPEAWAKLNHPTRALQRRSFVALCLCERTIAAARGCGFGGWFPGMKPVATRRCGICRYGHVACVEHSSGIIIGQGAPAWFEPDPQSWTGCYQ